MAVTIHPEFKHPEFDFDPAPVVVPSVLEQRFADYLARRPDVYRKLVTITRAFKAAGHERWSIAGAFEVLRYKVGIERGGGDQFAISNDFKPLMARKIMDENPDLDGIFELRARQC